MNSAPITHGLDDGAEPPPFPPRPGRVVALPAFASLGGGTRLFAAEAAAALAATATRRAVAVGLRLLPQRRHPGLLVAERRGGRLPVQEDPPAAGAAQGHGPGARRP